MVYSLSMSLKYIYHENEETECNTGNQKHFILLLQHYFLRNHILDLAKWIAKDYENTDHKWYDMNCERELTLIVFLLSSDNLYEGKQKHNFFLLLQHYFLRNHILNLKVWKMGWPHLTKRDARAQKICW